MNGRIVKQWIADLDNGIGLEEATERLSGMLERAGCQPIPEAQEVRSGRYRASMGLTHDDVFMSALWSVGGDMEDWLRAEYKAVMSRLQMSDLGELYDEL